MENLIIRTKKFALRIIRLFSSLPKTPAAQIIGKQVLRSGTSVGANYREACRARTTAEFVSTFGMCVKELEETHYWLELLSESGIIKTEKLNGLLDECSQLNAIFTAIIKKKRTPKG
jgi:four helix bundle protein